MIAFDTNSLVRLIVDDHPRQADLAEQLLKQHRVLISRTVLLETECVLRSRYQIPRERIHAFFQLMIQAENAEFEDAPAIEQALTWYATGADFADALHLAACGSTVLHTFDKDFSNAERQINDIPRRRAD